MENSGNLSGNLSNTILKSSEPIAPSFDTGSSDSSGFFDFLTNINFTTWLIIILILAFLGFNIFVYLAKGTQDITSFFGAFLEKILGTTGQVVDVSAEGAKAVVGGTAGAVNSGLSAVQNVTPGGVNANSSLPKQSINHANEPSENNTLNKALNASQKQDSNQDYEAHEASSSVYTGESGKAGWCYIGEDRGHRSCAKVGVNDTCMSGDIFPSQEICINPNLRP